MCFSKSLNPRRTSRREYARNLLFDAVVEDATPTKADRRRAERERNPGNRRTFRRAAQSRPATNPKTSSTTSTRPLTPTSGSSSSEDFITNTARPDQSLMPPGNFAHTSHIDLLGGLSNRPGYSQGISHNTFVPRSFTVTPESVASQFNSQNQDSTFTTEAIDIETPSVDEGYLLLETRLAVYQTDPYIPSVFENLAFSSSRDLWNTFEPHEMNPAELNRHMEETGREVQRRAAPPPPLDPNSQQASFPARLTFENGHTSQEMIIFNDDFEVNFVSQGYLNRLRTTSGKPPCLIPAPPIYQNVFTPDGTWAPIRYLLYADLQWLSPDFLFPPRQLCFVHYRGNGGADDTKLILGRSWSDSTKAQAPNWT